MCLCEWDMSNNFSVVHATTTHTTQAPDTYKVLFWSAVSAVRKVLSPPEVWLKRQTSKWELFSNINSIYWVSVEVFNPMLLTEPSSLVWIFCVSLPSYHFLWSACMISIYTEMSKKILRGRMAYPTMEPNPIKNTQVRQILRAESQILWLYSICSLLCSVFKGRSCSLRDLLLIWMV